MLMVAITPIAPAVEMTAVWKLKSSKICWIQCLRKDRVVLETEQGVNVPRAWISVMVVMSVNHTNCLFVIILIKNNFQIVFNQIRERERENLEHDPLICVGKLNCGGGIDNIQPYPCLF